MPLFLSVFTGMVIVFLTIAFFLGGYFVTKELKSEDKTFQKLNPIWTGVGIVVAIYVVGVIVVLIN